MLVLVVVLSVLVSSKFKLLFLLYLEGLKERLKLVQGFKNLDVLFVRETNY
jgi:hypothetical protein